VEDDHLDDGDDDEQCADDPERRHALSALNMTPTVTASSRCVWHVVGWQRSIREWATRHG
jgi:hypothetical protein